MACTSWRPQSQCTQWIAIDHVTAPPSKHLHKQHTQRADSAGTRALLNKSCSVEWAQLILYGGQRLVVNRHSQPLQLISLGKSLPLTCQEQSRLNCKRRMYTAHMVGTLQVPSLGDRGGCTTGPYRTPTILGHSSKTGSCNSST